MSIRKSETSKTSDVLGGLTGQHYKCDIEHSDGHHSTGESFSKEEAEQRAAERAAEYEDDDE